MIKHTVLINRILLGSLMLIPGLLKLFVMGPGAITGMMSGIAIFAWAPGFWAWILILSEIIFGVAILSNWKIEYTTIPPIIIIIVAAFTVNFNWVDLSQISWSSLLLHLTVASNYLMLGIHRCKTEKSKTKK